MLKEVQNNLNVSDPFASHSVKNKAGKKKLYSLLGIIGFILLIIGSIFLNIYFAPKQEEKIPTKGEVMKNYTLSDFMLTANNIDTAGIDPKTTFILKSKKDLSKKSLEKILTFNPVTKFHVKKISYLRNIIRAAYAQSPDIKDYPFTYEIIPEQELQKNSIYQVVLTDEDITERPYSWAFQVKAPFQVVQTHPRDKGTYVPINTGIEITFNREDILNPESYFQITPETSGKFEQYASTLIFIPDDPLLEKTVYSISLKAELTAKGSSESLGKDFSFQFETSETQYRGDYASVSISDNFFEFVPEKKVVFGIYYWNITPENFSVDVYKLPDVDTFIKTYQDNNQEEFYWTTYYKNEQGIKLTLDTYQKILSFKPSLIKSGYQEFIELPQIIPSGFYIIQLNAKDAKRNKEITRHSWLQVTPFSHYSALLEDKGFLWLYDFLKKSPLQKAEVSLYKDKSSTTPLGATDENGLLQMSLVNLLKNKDSDAQNFLKVGFQSFPSYIIPLRETSIYNYYDYYSGGADHYWDYLSTDRYTYQINDTVKFWGIIKGRSEDVRQKKVKVGLYSGYYYMYEGFFGDEGKKPLSEQEVMISSFDTFSGELSFKGVSPGYYRVSVMLDDKAIANTDIEILSYTKPIYQITVTPSKKAIFAGEEISFDVRANFFDGTPVSGLKLKYNGYWFSSIDGELVLDNNGFGVFRYIPAYYEKEYYPSSLRLTFSPVLSEEGEIWGSGNVLVFGPSLYLQAFQKRETSDSYKISAKVNHIVLAQDKPKEESYWFDEYIGNPAQGVKLSAQIVKIHYDKIEIGTSYDPINKVTYKRYDYVRREEVVDTLSGLSGDNGEWNISKTFPQEKSGQYDIRFSGVDFQGKKISANTYIYHTSDTYNTTYGDFSQYEGWKNFALELKIGDELYQNSYSMGDSVKLELVTKEGSLPKDTPILFYRYQNSIDRIQVSKESLFEEVFDKRFLPNVQYRAVVLSPFGFEETNTVIASFQEEENNITLDITADKEKYHPKDEANLFLQLQDKDKRPVLAEVNVAIVDEALFHILPYNWRQKILSGLYKDIYTNPITSSTFYTFLTQDGAAPSSLKEGAERGGCFGEGTKIFMADGTEKNIEDVLIGDRVLTFTDEQSRVLSPAIVQGVEKYYVSEMLIINHTLHVTPEHTMFINGKWEYAGHIKVGDTLIDARGKAQKVVSLDKKVTRKTPVYNLIIGSYHTYFADGFYVHNAEKGGLPRSNFVDVANYVSVRTDAEGKASIKFTMPDNITAWRVTAVAYAPESLKAGENVKLLEVTLPFFIESTLNNIYLSGDNPILKVRLYGTEYKQNEETEISIKSQKLGLDKKFTTKENTIYAEIGKLTEGDYEITITAKQGDLYDAIIEKVKVVKSFFKTSESSEYKLSENLQDIKGQKDGYTKLVFMDAGQGRFYDVLWQHSYLSGIRSDMKIASFMAQKMLSEYFQESKPENDLDLASYHVPSGGISLFTYGDTDLELTAKVSDIASEYVFQSQLLNYFYTSLKDKKADIHGISKILYGLASLKQPVLTKVNVVKENADLNEEDKTYLALALAKLGDKETARVLYEQDIRNLLKFQAKEAWLVNESDITKRVKLSGTIGVLASYLDYNDDSNALWNYIDTHDPQRDLDVLEETLLIKSEIQKLYSQKPSFTYTLGSKKENISLEKGSVYNLLLSEQELGTIRFENIKGDITLISFYERQKDMSELVLNSDLSLKRTYQVLGQTTNTFKEGDVILVRIEPSISLQAVDGMYQVIDFLPSGLKPITRPYEIGLVKYKSCVSTYPDQIIGNTIYFTVYKNENKVNYCQKTSIEYFARVVSQGDYNAHSAVLQSMKDLQLLNISAPDSVSIK